MQFEKCLNCTAITNKKCAGPNFMAMPTKDLVEWSIRYQKLHGINNAQLAEWSGIPKGTIDGIRYRDDVRHETIFRILKALIEGAGGEWGEHPCAETPDEDVEELTKRIDEQDREIKFMRETVEFAEDQLKSKSKALITLAIALGVAIAVLIVDLFIMHMH